MIKFNQPRYILPLIVLPFIYVFFYMYQYTFGKEEAPEIYRQTASINPDLPDPFLDKDNMKGKFDAYLEAYKNNRDFSAMQEIDRREEQPKTQIVDTIPTPVLHKRILANTGNRVIIQRRSYLSSTPVQQELSDYEKQMRLFKAQMNYMDSLFGTPTASLQSTKESPSVNLRRPKEDTCPLSRGSVDINYDSEGVKFVEKKGSPSASLRRLKETKTGHFNTIIKDKRDFFIKAIIDEELKVSKDSRIRIRLLEDVVIGEQVIPKGNYLYGIVASFKPQRVEVHISSMLLKDQIIEIAVDIYDMDGMKGLYVPESQFRELAKSMGSNMASGQQLNIDHPPDNQMQLMYGLAKDAFNTTTQAASKAIRKNKARLKYNTMVYLVNTKKQNTSSTNQLTL